MWQWVEPHAVTLKKGMNSICFLTDQDDVKLDQIVLTRAKDAPWSATSRTVSGRFSAPSHAERDIPAVTMSLSSPTLNLLPGEEPEVTVFMRNNSGADIKRTLHHVLDLPRQRKRERSIDVTLKRETALVGIPLELTLDGPRELREYLLRCELRDGDTVEQTRTIAFVKSWDWSILGPLPYINIDSGDEQELIPPTPELVYDGKAYRWQRYDPTFSDHFAIMDFGRVFSGSVYSPMTNAAVYAYTEIHVAEAGEYLVKTQGDDALIVWIHGRHAVTSAHEKATAIRSAKGTKVTLQAGRNPVLFRLNQKSGQWQASVRVRTVDDQIADVAGIRFANQRARLTKKE